jgi:DNA-binding response OmpR family regulator
VSEVAEIRARTQAPLVLLVEKLTEEQHCQLLDAGADIVLEKPVSPRILTRYSRMLLRRAGTVPASILPSIEVGDVTLDPATRVVRRDGRDPLPLAPLEFRLLYLLMTNPEWVIPVDTIVERVWGYSGDGNRDLVRGLVRRLRRKIEPEPGKHRYIQNVPSVGYRFMSEAIDS